MTKFTKGFILGVFAGAVIMFASVFFIGWQYTIKHPASVEEIVVDSFPADTAVYLGTYEGTKKRR